MAAPKGNQFWKMRSKHGRDKLFASPELLWAAACEYFQWCDEHPWEYRQTTDKGRGEKKTQEVIAKPTARPYTLTGLCLYCNASFVWWRTFRTNCEESDEKGFLSVITRIEEVIETQQFEGACVGAFNANIIARKLGLAEKQQQEVNAKVSGLNIVVENKQDAELVSKIENL